MLTRFSLAFCGLCLVVLISGCNTCKGAAEGLSKDVEEAKKADTWIQKNLW